MQIKTLIDMAAKVAGSQTLLGIALGVSANRITDWKTGVIGCPLKIHVRLCDVAGLDDHETREHLREAARVPTPKARAGALASIALVVAGVVVSAAAFMSDAIATMYIM
ncbi:MAG: hypothetical protein ABI671_12135 [Burkholderiales bacterium]